MPERGNGALSPNLSNLMQKTDWTGGAAIGQTIPSGSSLIATGRALCSNLETWLFVMQTMCLRSPRIFGLTAWSFHRLEINAVPAVIQFGIYHFKASLHPSIPGASAHDIGQPIFHKWRILQVPTVRRHVGRFTNPRILLGKLGNALHLIMKQFFLGLPGFRQ